jgi:hypothetical protein
VPYTPGCTAGSETETGWDAPCDAPSAVDVLCVRRLDRARESDRSGSRKERADPRTAIEAGATDADAATADLFSHGALPPFWWRYIPEVGDGSRARRPGPVVTVAAVGAVTSMTGW